MRKNKYVFLCLTFLFITLHTHAQSIQFTDFEQITGHDWAAFQLKMDSIGFEASAGTASLSKGHYEKNSYEQIGYVEQAETEKSVTYVCNNRHYLEALSAQMLADTNWVKVPTGDRTVQYCNVAKHACVVIEDKEILFSLTYTWEKK